MRIIERSRKKAQRWRIKNEHSDGRALEMVGEERVKWWVDVRDAHKGGHEGQPDFCGCKPERRLSSNDQQLGWWRGWRHFRLVMWHHQLSWSGRKKMGEGKYKA